MRTYFCHYQVLRLVHVLNFEYLMSMYLFASVSMLPMTNLCFLASSKLLQGMDPRLVVLELENK